ncbi:uncharacterized protein LOC134535862 isoform X2 [Bacillus rossius redtenbacheri]|uniref:uncharacterized protein LOC134535862 isoform X2 n=1 Tax=Bacillus rossius redtenbacheri TaxID=93214 RepID=UPI002FDDDC14
MKSQILSTTSLLLLVLFSIVCHAVPKKYDVTGGFVPTYLSEQQADPENLPGRLVRSEIETGAVAHGKELTKEPKFGFISYGGSGQGYGTGVQTGGLKIDLGGVVLGALIGLGAVLIIPKLLTVVEKPVHEGYHTYGGYGGYGRSEESAPTNITSGVMRLLTQVDDALSKHNIDSTSCMQRAVCSYVKSATHKVAEGSATSLDSIVDTVTRNTMLSVMLDGSSLKQALEMGQQGANCGATFPKCPFNKDTVYIALKSILPE